MSVCPDLSSLLEQSGMPNSEWWHLVSTAYDELCRTLTADSCPAEHGNHANRPVISIFRTGNFACELTSRDEVLKCLAFGTIRTELFLEVAWQRITEAQANGLKIHPFEVSERQILLNLSGVLFSVRYLESSDLMRQYPTIVDVPRSVQFGLPTELDEAVETLRDMKLFNEHTINFPIFRQLHHTLRVLMICNGLYENEQACRLWDKYATPIGCFDADLLRELSWKILLRSEHERNTGNISAMILGYLSHHETCLEDPTKDECDFYSDSNSPFAQRWSANNLRTVHERFKDLSILLATRTGRDIEDPIPNEKLYKVLQGRLARPFSQFFVADFYIQITMQYSGQSQLDGTKMMDLVQERFGDLIKELDSSVKGVYMHPWPTRVVDIHATKHDNPYEGYWMGGVAVQENSLWAIVEPILLKWNEKICSSYRFSSASMVVRAELISHKVMEQQDMKEDQRTWPRPVAKPDPRYSIERTTRNLPKTAQSPPFERSESPRKLRPAMEVLSRLRYDPAFDLDDFVIGYTDRHAGILEKTAGSWVSESTDEEWIPQGRIQYFKRVSDDVRVWDRASKSNLVFK